MIGGEIVEVKERIDAHIRLKVRAVHPNENGAECFVRLAYKPGLASFLEQGDRVWWTGDKAFIKSRELGKDITCDKMGDAFFDLEAPAGSSAEENIEYCGSAGGLAMFRLTPQPRTQLLRHGEPVSIALDVVGLSTEMLAGSIQFTLDRAAMGHPIIAIYKAALQDLKTLQAAATQPS